MQLGAALGTEQLNGLQLAPPGHGEAGAGSRFRPGTRDVAAPDQSERRSSAEPGARWGRFARDILLRALDDQDPGLREHVRGVGDLARALGARLGMSSRERQVMLRAAELHDVGKLAMPTSILGKAGPLGDDEWALMHQHTIIGQRMLDGAPTLTAAGVLVRASHEHYDGNGYPVGLACDEIHLGARIIAICDAFDAMTSERTYGERLQVDDALAELRDCAGTQFDPALVESFCQIVGEVLDRRRPLRAAG